MLGSFKLRKYERDYEKIIDAMIDSYLGKISREHTFKTDRYKLLGSFVDNTTFFSNNLIATDNDRINEVILLIEGIKRGDVVDLKAYSLKPDNALVIQNDRNRYKKGDVSAEDVLSHCDDYNKGLCEEVYLDFVKSSPLYAIEQYKTFMTKSSLFELLSRVNADENTLEISNEALLALFSDLDLQNKDYVKISTSLSSMVPEQRIKLFETLSDENEEVTEAYLYTLFDLEMVSVASEILDVSQPNEYVNLKAYRALKDCNKHFNVNLFV